MLAKIFRRHTPRRDYELSDVMQTAAEGRRLAIYDRATGLYAYWYIQLRGEEEVSRARRSGNSFACISLWAPTPLLIEQLARHLGEHLRTYDIASYLNNGHFFVLLLETGEAGADIVLRRILAATGDGIAGGVVSFPRDGKTFDELLEAAKTRAGGSDRAA